MGSGGESGSGEEWEKRKRWEGGGGGREGKGGGGEGGGGERGEGGEWEKGGDKRGREDQFFTNDTDKYLICWILKQYLHTRQHSIHTHTHTPQIGPVKL